MAAYSVLPPTRVRNHVRFSARRGCARTAAHRQIPTAPVVAQLADRPAAPDCGRPASNHRQGRRAGGLRLRRAFLNRVRDPGNPLHPGGRGDRCVRLRLSDLHRDRGAAGDRHAFLRADHPCLSGRRRGLHRGPRQPGRAARPGRRRVIADRLYPHGGRVHLSRRGADYVRVSRALRFSGRDRGRAGPVHDGGQPARRAGIGRGLRHPQLFLPGDDGGDGAHRDDPLCGGHAGAGGGSATDGNGSDHAGGLGLPDPARVCERHHRTHRR